MSFILEPATSLPEEGDQRTWLKHLEDEVISPSESRRRVATESLQAIKAQKLRTRLLVSWIFIFVLVCVYVGTHMAAQSTKRGKDNSMWLTTVALMDASLVLGSLLLSALGLWMKDEIYMRQSSILQLIAASWYVIQVTFNMVFVVILSKIGGEWQRRGKYTLEEVESFNSFIIGVVVVGVLLAPLMFLCSRLAWDLSKVYEIERVVRKFPDREDRSSPYGTFTALPGRQTQQ
ncbi:hypothetical protein Esti_002345 [Eimeria stiedai]